MKVYIKPWEEALKSTKEFDERLVDTTVDGVDFILGILRQSGDWGYIVEAEKNDDDKFDYYTTYYKNTKRFTYPACCVEEITPEWLEEHALIFIEDIISTNSTTNTRNKRLKDYKTYRITIYKATDALHTYFFNVRRVSHNGLEETVEDFREIK